MEKIFKAYDDFEEKLLVFSLIFSPPLTKMFLQEEIMLIWIIDEEWSDYDLEHDERNRVYY